MLLGPSWCMSVALFGMSLIPSVKKNTIIIFVVTSIQGIYNISCIPEKDHVSSAHGSAAAL